MHSKTTILLLNELIETIDCECENNNNGKWRNINQKFQKIAKELQVSCAQTIIDKIYDGVENIMPLVFEMATGFELQAIKTIIQEHNIDDINGLSNNSASGATSMMTLSQNSNDNPSVAVSLKIKCNNIANCLYVRRIVQSLNLYPQPIQEYENIENITKQLLNDFLHSLS
eukprot:132080_1